MIINGCLGEKMRMYAFQNNLGRRITTLRTQAAMKDTVERNQLKRTLPCIECEVPEGKDLLQRNKLEFLGLYRFPEEVLKAVCHTMWSSLKSGVTKKKGSTYNSRLFFPSEETVPTQSFKGWDKTQLLSRVLRSQQFCSLILYPGGKLQGCGLLPGEGAAKGSVIQQQSNVPVRLSGCIHRQLHIHVNWYIHVHTYTHTRAHTHPVSLMGFSFVCREASNQRCMSHDCLLLPDPDSPNYLWICYLGLSKKQERIKKHMVKWLPKIRQAHGTFLL